MSSREGGRGPAGKRWRPWASLREFTWRQEHLLPGEGVLPPTHPLQTRPVSPRNPLLPFPSPSIPPTSSSHPAQAEGPCHRGQPGCRCHQPATRPGLLQELPSRAPDHGGAAARAGEPLQGVMEWKQEQLAPAPGCAALGAGRACPATPGGSPELSAPWSGDTSALSRSPRVAAQPVPLQQPGEGTSPRDQPGEGASGTCGLRTCREPRGLCHFVTHSRSQDTAAPKEWPGRGFGHWPH